MRHAKYQENTGLFKQCQAGVKCPNLGMVLFWLFRKRGFRRNNGDYQENGHESIDQLDKEHFLCFGSQCRSLIFFWEIECLDWISSSSQIFYIQHQMKNRPIVAHFHALFPQMLSGFVRFKEN